MKRRTMLLLGTAALGFAAALAVTGLAGVRKLVESSPGLASTDASGVVYVAPGGSDANACTADAPCFTFKRAYRAAAPGWEVEVAEGTYGPQTIENADKVTPEDVVFRPAPGADVVVTGELTIFGKHVEFRKMKLAGGWQARACSDDVTIRSVQSKHFFISSASNVRVLGGSVGPGLNYDSQIAAVSSGACAGQPPTNILIDGVDFHDWTRNDPKYHIECLQVGSGDGVTIRNSRFRNCATHDIFIRGWGSPVMRNFTIENNFLDDAREGYFALRVAPATGVVCEDFLVRNNSSLEDMLLDCVSRNARFLSNIQPTMSSTLCNAGTGVVWNHNVYGRGTKCGPNDVVAPLGFRDIASFDLHLVEGAAAIDHGAADAPAADVDGDARPMGAAPDAGADEAA